MKSLHQYKIVVFSFLFAICIPLINAQNSKNSNTIVEKGGIKSIDTQYTISKVRIAKKGGKIILLTVVLKVHC